MRKNVGGGGRTVRSIAGVVLAAVALRLDLEPGWALLAFMAALVFLLTALVSYCPINAALDRDRRRHASGLR